MFLDFYTAFAEEVRFQLGLPQGVDCLHACESCSCATGAFGLDGSLLTGKTLLNLDTEDWGEIFIGCAGKLFIHHLFAASSPLNSQPLQIAHLRFIDSQ